MVQNIDPKVCEPDSAVCLDDKWLTDDHAIAIAVSRRFLSLFFTFELSSFNCKAEHIAIEHDGN